MKEGTIGDMSILGITESFQVKRQVLLSAAAAAAFWEKMNESNLLKTQQTF